MGENKPAKNEVDVEYWLRTLVDFPDHPLRGRLEKILEDNPKGSEKFLIKVEQIRQFGQDGLDALLNIIQRPMPGEMLFKRYKGHAVYYAFELDRKRALPEFIKALDFRPRSGNDGLSIDGFYLDHVEFCLQKMPEAVPLLCDYARNREKAGISRAIAVRILARMGHDFCTLKGRTCEGMELINEKDLVEISKLIIDLTKDPEPEVRRNAAGCFFHVNRNENEVKKLYPLLEDKDGHVVKSAFYSLLNVEKGLNRKEFKNALKRIIEMESGGADAVDTELKLPDMISSTINPPKYLNDYKGISDDGRLRLARLANEAQVEIMLERTIRAGKLAPPAEPCTALDYHEWVNGLINSSQWLKKRLADMAKNDPHAFNEHFAELRKLEKVCDSYGIVGVKKLQNAVLNGEETIQKGTLILRSLSEKLTVRGREADKELNEGNVKLISFVQAAAVEGRLDFQKTVMALENMMLASPNSMHTESAYNGNVSFGLEIQKKILEDKIDLLGGLEIIEKLNKISIKLGTRKNEEGHVESEDEKKFQANMLLIAAKLGDLVSSKNMRMANGVQGLNFLSGMATEEKSVIVKAAKSMLSMFMGMPDGERTYSDYTSVLGVFMKMKDCVAPDDPEFNSVLTELVGKIHNDRYSENLKKNEADELMKKIVKMLSTESGKIEECDRPSDVHSLITRTPTMGTREIKSTLRV